MNINKLSAIYKVRKLDIDDIESIYELSIKNPMYYEYCPPFVTKEGVLADMKALPPNKAYEDKFHIGFFENEQLVAVMDLIIGYPTDEIAWIGLFMMEQCYQGKGIGSKIVDGCCTYLKELGYSYIDLAYAKGNPQSEAFWLKNQFLKTGAEADLGEFIAVKMRRKL